MPIRHVVASSNVNQCGIVVDPRLARHCVIVAGRLKDVSGDVDPRTHLNLDFDQHTLGFCVVADGLDRGAIVLRDADGMFVFAMTPVDAMEHLGRVDIGARRSRWLAALHERPERARVHDG